MPFLPSPREAKVEGEGVVGGGSGAALELLKAWRDGGVGVCGEWAGGRPARPVGLAPRVRGLWLWASLEEAGRPEGMWLYNTGYGGVKFPPYHCGCDTDEGIGAGEKGWSQVLDQPLRSLEELPFGHGCGSGACA